MDRATKNTQQGLTIFELMIVMTIVVIIASISIATLAAAVDRSRQRATMADMRVISRAIERLTPESVVAVGLLVSELYDQTPGPSAGQRVGSAP